MLSNAARSVVSAGRDMLSLQFIRDHAELVREGVARKGADAPLDEILDLDRRW